MRTSIDLQGYLINWRAGLEKAAERKRVQGMEAHQEAESIEADIDDLDRAIAALTPAPAPVEIEIPEGVPVIPATEWTEPLSGLAPDLSSDYPDEQDDASFEFEIGRAYPEMDEPDDMFLDGEISHDGDPAIEPESGLHEERAPPDPWSQGHMAGFRALDRDPNRSDRWQDGYDAGAHDRAYNIKLGLAVPNYDGTHAEAPALNEAMQDEREEPVALAQPEWNEPQTTEGYAPVTNPAADEAAKAHDWYDPKAVHERERNAGLAKLFSYNPFYKPKVEA